MKVKKQDTGNKRHEARSKKQVILISVMGLRTEGAGLKEQEAGCKRQDAGGRKQEVTRGNKGEAT